MVTLEVYSKLGAGFEADLSTNDLGDDDLVFGADESLKHIVIHFTKTYYVCQRGLELKWNSTSLREAEVAAGGSW